MKQTRNFWLDRIREEYQSEADDPFSSTDVDMVIVLLGIGQELQRMNQTLVDLVNTLDPEASK